MNEPALNKRIRQIRRQMRDQAVDLLLLVKPSHVCYVTGFMGQDSWAAVTGRHLYLLTDSRYTEQAEKECPTCRIVNRGSRRVPSRVCWTTPFAGWVQSPPLTP